MHCCGQVNVRWCQARIWDDAFVEVCPLVPCAKGTRIARNSILVSDDYFAAMTWLEITHILLGLFLANPGISEICFVTLEMTVVRPHHYFPPSYTAKRTMRIFSSTLLREFCDMIPRTRCYYMPPSPDVGLTDLCRRFSVVPQYGMSSMDSRIVRG